MNLAENKHVPKALVATLEAAGWTISKLSTAGLKQLTRYPGIGAVTAKRIIEESREMMNEAVREEIEAMQPNWAFGDKPLSPPEDAPVSVRIKRIREANR